MIVTTKISEDLVSRHHKFAPKDAMIIALHEDGRVFFAESMQIGSKIWDADSLRERKMQGIIHNLVVIARRNRLTPSKWDINAILKSRSDRMMAHQEALTSARKSSPEVVPAASSTQVIKAEKKIEPIPAATPVDNNDEDAFVSIRTLEPAVRRRKAGDLFLSVRSNGKIILGKAFREKIADWAGLNIMVSRNFKRIAVSVGPEYEPNKSGTYLNRALAAKLAFPEDSGTIRVILEWDKDLNAFVGSFQ